MGRTPDVGVLTWLDALPPAEVATTAVTAAELLHRAARLPDGQRKSSLMAAIHELLDEDFQGRVEPFDLRAAVEYAAVVREREHLGRPVSTADAQIAAICRARRATLATRNIKDFEETGIELVKPRPTSQIACACAPHVEMARQRHALRRRLRRCGGVARPPPAHRRSQAGAVGRNPVRAPGSPRRMSLSALVLHAAPFTTPTARARVAAFSRDAPFGTRHRRCGGFPGTRAGGTGEGSPGCARR